MTERQRTTAVGIFVLIGFGLLAFLILRFSYFAMIAKGGYLVEAHVPHSGGAIPDKTVHYLGVAAGTVAGVRLAEGDMGVVVTLRIKDDVDIPANAQLRISPTGFGDTYIDIELPTDAVGRRVEPAPPLKRDGTARLAGVTTGAQLVPKSLTDRIERTLAKFERLDVLLANLAEMTEPRSLDDVESGRKPPNLAAAVARFDHTLSALADDENVRNMKETLQSLSVASARLDQTLKRAEETFGKAGYAIDKVSSDVDEVRERADRLLAKLLDDAAKVSNLLDTLNSLAKGVQEGEGSVGKLLKSDDLHRQLVLLVEQMNLAFQDLSRLIVKLEMEGLMRKGG